MDTLQLLTVLSVFALTAADYSPPQDQQSRLLRTKGIYDESNTVFYVTKEQHKMVAILPKTHVCKFYGSKTLIIAALEEEINKMVVSVDETGFKEVMRDCYNHIKQNPTLYFALQNDIQLIFPGTKWCGDGDIADDYEDLGFFSETDKCCRDHDHCPDWIPGWGTEHELFNPTPFTRSHCDCDDQLKSCLNSANDIAGDTIGLTYFSILGMKCFREDYPIVQCNEYGGLFNMYCQDYTLDDTQPKIWEFFDDSVFEDVQTSNSDKAAPENNMA